MMHAIYEGKTYHLGDDLNEAVLLDRKSGKLIRVVPYGAPSLIIDPTDAQIEAAEAGKPIPPETCAICHTNPHYEDEWRYFDRDGYGVCEECGRKKQVNHHG